MAQSTKSWRPSLLTAPWRPFRIDEQHYLIKSVFLDTSYDIAVTDLVGIWLEHVDLDDFIARSKALNPTADAPPSRFIRQIGSYIQQQKSDGQYSISQMDGDDPVGGELVLGLQTKIARFTHKWEFHLQPGTQLEMSHHLVCPLITASGELARRITELQNVIKKKDKEIAEYKNSNAQLGRRHLETAVFDVKTFTSEMLVSEAFKNIVSAPSAASFTAVQDLYEQVMQQRCKQEQEREDRDEDFADGALFGEPGSYTQQLPSSLVPSALGSTGSHTYHLPSSLIPQSTSEPAAKRPFTRTPPVSPSKSPAKRSPVKSPEVPSQDAELVRRQQIEERLKAEAEKKKTKKKKITKL